MPDVRTLLNLDRWDDLSHSEAGFIAGYRPDIAPRAYDVYVNKPLRTEVMPELVKFAEPVPSDAIETLFGLCNGVMVGRTKFNVFGVLDKHGGADHAHTPFDTNVPNIYERPAALGDEPLILAHSGTKNASTGESEEFCHYIDRAGIVSVAPYEDLLTPERKYDSVTEWLCSEFEIAVFVLEAERVET